MNRFLGLILGALLAVFAGPALAADLTATAADAPAKFAAAQAGDTLHLTGAFPDVLVLQDRTFATPLKIDASQATFSAVIVQRVIGLAWSGGTFRPIAAVGRPALSVFNLKSAAFDRLSYVGDGTLNGFNARDSADLAITSSTFERPRVAISLMNVQGFKVLANQIWGWSADGIGLMSASNGLVEKNACLNPIRLDDTHIDCIQGYFTGTTANQYITVRSNLCAAPGAQCIFFNAYAGYPAPKAITIENNSVETADAPNGILLQGDPAGAVRNNRAATLPGSKWQTNIWTLDPTTPHCGNSAEAYSVWAAVTDAACATN